jgi:TIR domain
LSDIFISYRRQDSDAYAGRLYDRLAARFDKARIFMDIDMDLGIDFANEIEQRVGSCKVLVAVIGRSWMEVKDGEGRRRLDDPNDWVRLEVVAALERNIPVIPALVGGAKMPAASDLPEVLSKLTRRQAIEITHTGFHSDVDRLIRGLEKILPPEEKKKTPIRRRTAHKPSEGSTQRTGEPSKSLKVLKIFLASSSDLREDRDAFELYFRQQNDRFAARGLYLQIVRWESFLDAMSETRLQDEYNKALRDCDIFVGLFFTKVGQFPEEEFDIAYRSSGTRGLPVFTSISRMPTSASTLEGFGKT